MALDSKEFFSWAGLVKNKDFYTEGPQKLVDLVKGDAAAFAGESFGSNEIEALTKYAMEGIRANKAKISLTPLQVVKQAKEAAVALSTKVGGTVTNYHYSTLKAIHSNEAFIHNSPTELANIAIQYATVLATNVSGL